MKRLWQVLILAILVACQPTGTVTQTSTLVPTNTSTPLITPTTELPVRYKLRQPQPDELLKMIDSVLSMEQNRTYEENAITFIRDREPTALQHLIGADFERYYHEGFPNAQDFVTRDVLPWQLQSFGDLNSASIVLRIALLQYINTHPDVLEKNRSLALPNVNIKLYAMDLDGDTRTEWLIGAEYPEYSLQNWLLIRKGADGLYHELPSFDYDPATLQSFTNDIEVVDLTGDGNPEIIKIQRYYLAGAIHGDLNVYTWNENKLYLYGEVDLPSPPPMHGEGNLSEFVVKDFNKDGVADIRVDTPRFRRFGCKWTQSDTYYFDGPELEVETVGGELPPTKNCLIARALESENISDQINLYQAAQQTFDASVAPLDQLAWIKLQLAMAYTAVGDDVRATSQLRELIAMQGDGKFLEFIKTKYAETNQPSPLAFCDELYSAVAAQLITDNLGSEIDVDLTHGAYPVDYAPVPDLICPFPQTLMERLENTEIPASHSPVDALIARGYSFSQTQPLNWDDDPEQEWLGILDFHEPMLVLMNAETNWKLSVSQIPLFNVQDFEANIFTSPGNTSPTVLVLFSGMSKFCNPANIARSLMEIHPDTMERASYSLCNSTQYSLGNDTSIQFAIEEFIKPSYSETVEMPAWYYLSDPAQNVNERPILDLVSEIEVKVASQMYLEETSLQLSQLIASLPQDDPAAQILLNRLYYLLGLYYEIEHQNELAVQTYLKLIKSSPDSIWSEYAQLRIQRVP